jgi:hypothetical protein
MRSVFYVTKSICMRSCFWEKWESLIWASHKTGVKNQNYMSENIYCRLYGKSTHRWENNIKMVLGEIGYEGVLDTTDSGQGPTVGLHKQTDEPLGSWNAGNIFNQLLKDESVWWH